ncbi:MAG: putative small protein [Phormidium sp. OSCR]|nr:MAG: putative small protein [Phormidium sp. OSCR]
MQAMNLQIPLELIEQGETAVLEKIAIQLYENQIFTFGQARRLLNYSVWEFQKLLGENHVVRQYDQEDLAEDIEGIKSGLWDG